jgi:RNA ligase
MLKVIDFIKSNSNWREMLTNTPYCLSILDEGEFIILKFTYKGSDFNNEIVRECRGLIIDKYLNPVCVPFSKFFNYGEPYADKIDWSSALVEEKIDGMLIKIWNYRETWMISTKDTILAEKVILNSKKETNSNFKNYSELFIAALKKIKFDMNLLNPKNTYLFELVSPYNRLIVPYESIDVYHIGTRENVTGQELEINTGIKKPKVYECSNISALIEMASKLKPSEEGYVVKDKNYKRIKVKAPAYIAAKHFVGEMNEKKIMEIIKTNYAPELLAYFPEYKKQFDAVTKAFKL